MRPINCLSLAAVFSLLALSPASATATDAQRIQKTYQLQMDTWTLEIRVASTPADRAKAWSNRPDATPAAREMWIAISTSLDQDWTLEPAAWFFQNTSGLLAKDAAGLPKPIFAKENEAIRNAIEKSHLSSPKLGPVCSALAISQDPRSLAILEKIQASHPDQKIQGIAALGAAMQLKALGDDGDIMRKRLTYLRKAIIQSSDAEINGTAVAKLAEDELYIIRFLTKGRIAPDLVGVDSGGKALSLDANKGKVIVLLFWNSNVVDAQRVVEITTAMDAKFKNKPFAIMGVNNDTTEKLRALQADGTVPWTNFSDPENHLASTYRVGNRPLVYVLDGERKIHYAGPPGSFVELTAAALLEGSRRK
jgi:peroxiredoxin